jgi:hypothetical protein
MPLQAVRLRNDEGDWMAAINDEEAGEWVEGANAIFAASGIRFTYDPERDFTTLDNTMLNMMDVEDSSFGDEHVFLGDSVAARYPGRLVVFFRHGPLEPGVEGSLTRHHLSPCPVSIR